MSACKTCGVTLGRGNKTGYCRRHVSAGALKSDHGDRIRAGLAKYFADPANKQRAREQIRKNGSTEHAKRRRSEVAKEIGLYRIGHKTAHSDVARAKRSEKISAVRLAWCPRELRDQYRHLVRSKRMPAAEARALILAQHELEMKRFRRDVLGVAG